MSKKDDEVLGAIIGIGAAIGLGLLGAAILDSLSGPRCPNCNHKINRNDRYCKYCNAYLRWN